MLIDRSRDKLINAIVYLASNTKYCGKIKLFKLLYLVDFEHFRLTGRSVTGCEYKAWKFGPVPTTLNQEWDVLSADLAAKIRIVPEPVMDYVRETVVPKTDFDDTNFTKREVRIMAELAAKYADAQSPKMIDVTHAENGAWANVWQGGIGQDKTILYEYALSQDTPHREAILEASREYNAAPRKLAIHARA